jgi:hypothetical protein
MATRGCSPRIRPAAEIDAPLARGLLPVAKGRAFDFCQEISILLDQVRARELLSIMAEEKKDWIA